MSKSTNRDHYAPVIKAWATAPVKLGPVPTEANFAVAHAFAPRGAGKQSLGFAMALRPQGMTVDQMLHAALLYDQHTGAPAPRGTPCRNQFKLPQVCGEIERPAGAPRGAIAFTLTAKGKARLDRQAQLIAAKAPAAPTKAAKAKAPKAVKVARKANKAKAAPTVAPTAENAPAATAEASSAIVASN